MKKLFFVLSLSMISSPLFCGLQLSKMLAPSPEIKQSRKIKISDKETLVSIFRKKAANIDALNQMGILDTFAGQEMYEHQVEERLDTAFNNFWIQTSAQIETRIGKAEFEKQKDTQYGNFMRQCLEIKPGILEGIREATKAHTATGNEPQN